MAGIRDWQQILEIIDQADTLLDIDCVHLDALPAQDRLRRQIERDAITIYRRDA